MLLMREWIKAPSEVQVQVVCAPAYLPSFLPNSTPSPHVHPIHSTQGPEPSFYRPLSLCLPLRCFSALRTSRDFQSWSRAPCNQYCPLSFLLCLRENTSTAQTHCGWVVIPGNTCRRMGKWVRTGCQQVAYRKGSHWSIIYPGYPTWGKGAGVWIHPGPVSVGCMPSLLAWCSHGQDGLWLLEESAKIFSK